MFHSLNAMKKAAEGQDKPLWQIVIEDDMKERLVKFEESFSTMQLMYEQMKHADATYEKDIKSASGCVGGDGHKLEEYFKTNQSLSGDFIGKVMEKAIKMGESNACMKRIVAAPTAGSCGVMPAVFLTLQEKFDIPDKKMVEGLYVAAGVGQVIAHRASISGAEGGCQAEIGSASAMTAAGLAYIRGGDTDCVLHAAAMALKNLLGLTCDPVAGLVEIPCVKRNVIGSVNAVTSCDMALAGMRSFIPPDEVIDAMRQIGDLMPTCLKETSEAGLALSPTASKLAKNHIS